jgi:hypothetical protein
VSSDDREPFPVATVALPRTKAVERWVFHEAQMQRLFPSGVTGIDRCPLCDDPVTLRNAIGDQDQQQSKIPGPFHDGGAYRISNGPVCNAAERPDAAAFPLPVRVGRGIEAANRSLAWRGDRFTNLSHLTEAALNRRDEIAGPEWFHYRFMAFCPPAWHVMQITTYDDGFGPKLRRPVRNHPPIAVGQPPVNYHQIVGLCDEAALGLSCRAGDIYAVTPAAQGVAHRVLNIGLVLNEEDALDPQSSLLKERPALGSSPMIGRCG